jgi:hypothetical protein
MMKLGLDELFSPGLLKAFRERWGASPYIADAEAQEIVRQLTNPSEKEALAVKIVLCLVGDEPDFYAWMEALAGGTFELRPNVKYAQPGKMHIQPARFFADQRKIIDRLAHKHLKPEEMHDWRHAYEDALRLIVASQLLKEMRIGVAAKAALGLAWPLMLAADQKKISSKNRKLLHLYGSEPEFIDRLSDAIKGAIGSWTDTHHDGVGPSTRHYLSDYLSRLPGEPTFEEVTTTLDPGSKGVREYREALFRCLGIEPLQEENRIGAFDNESVAMQDAKVLREQIGSLPSPLTSFTAYLDSVDTIIYSTEDVERLGELLPILRGTSGPYSRAACNRSMVRDHLRRNSPASVSDLAVQQEIADWVRKGLPPPPDLKVENSAYFEEDFCNFGYNLTVHSKWEDLVGFNLVREYVFYDIG